MRAPLRCGFAPLARPFPVSPRAALAADDTPML
jgi:hypothetical protein